MDTPLTQRDLLFFAIGALAGWILSRFLKSFNVTVRSAPSVTFEDSPKRNPIVTREVKTTVNRKFVVNGKEYKSLEEVPSPFREKIRETLRDENGDGIPDILQKR
jgi:hypothetical protein